MQMGSLELDRDLRKDFHLGNIVRSLNLYVRERNAEALFLLGQLTGNTRERVCDLFALKDSPLPFYRALTSLLQQVEAPVVSAFQLRDGDAALPQAADLFRILRSASPEQMDAIGRFQDPRLVLVPNADFRRYSHELFSAFQTILQLDPRIEYSHLSRHDLDPVRTTHIPSLEPIQTPEFRPITAWSVVVVEAAPMVSPPEWDQVEAPLGERLKRFNAHYQPQGVGLLTTTSLTAFLISEISQRRNVSFLTGSNRSRSIQNLTNPVLSEQLGLVNYRYGGLEIHFESCGFSKKLPNAYFRPAVHLRAPLR